MVSTGGSRRVVVTGMGAVSPLGHDVTSTWDALVAGRSGVGPITLFDASSSPVRIAAEVKGWDGGAVFGAKDARHLDRFCQFALVAARQALGQSGVAVGDDPERVGVVFGSGLGGVGTLEEQAAVLGRRGPTRVNPFTLPMLIANAAAGQIAIDTGARGPNTCTVTACAASANAIGDAAELIRSGRADAVIAGGADAAITPLCIAAFASMRALSARNDEPERASRPFDAGRDGFVSAEGAAALVLEARQVALARGASVLGEVLGYGASCDAHHITAPDATGRGAVAAMRAALGQAGLAPADVDYVNAHGTSTPPNDRTETLAVRAVLGPRVPVSSTKSMTGHLLGAAGALEAVVCLKVLETGILPPTINHEDPDPDCDLDYVPNVARTATVDTVMTNSFGFGGHNATLVLGRG
ncbi:MAG: beta-ketoacyl-ACP synthase II [Acidimicrobiales bacterium]